MAAGDRANRGGSVTSSDDTLVNRLDPVFGIVFLSHPLPRIARAGNDPPVPDLRMEQAALHTCPESTDPRVQRTAA